MLWIMIFGFAAYFLYDLLAPTIPYGMLDPFTAGAMLFMVSILIMVTGWGISKKMGSIVPTMDVLTERKYLVALHKTSSSTNPVFSDFLTPCGCESYLFYTRDIGGTISPEMLPIERNIVIREIDREPSGLTEERIPIFRTYEKRFSNWLWYLIASRTRESRYEFFVPPRQIVEE